MFICAESLPAGIQVLSSPVSMLTVIWSLLPYTIAIPFMLHWVQFLTQVHKCQYFFSTNIQLASRAESYEAQIIQFHTPNPKHLKVLIQNHHHLYKQRYTIKKINCSEKNSIWETLFLIFLYALFLMVKALIFSLDKNWVLKGNKVIYVVPLHSLHLQ